MTRSVKRGAYRRTCRTCSWTGTYDTAAKASHAKRRHSCSRWLAKAAAAERGQARLAAVDRTPKPCLHKQANHQHGTYACYTLDACRCEPCCVAVSVYETERVRQHAYGRWNGLVDAEPARIHVRRLMAAGMGLKRICAVADLSSGVIWKLLYGCPRVDGTRRPPQKRLRPATADRILAVELDLADGAKVATTDTARRLQALVALGWSMSKLGTRLGWTPGNFNPVVNGTQREVTVRTAKAVHSLYLALVDQAPPEDEWRDRIAASRARNLASARGWAKPLRINGRIHIGSALPLPDDALEVVDTSADADDYDEAAVLRRLSGDRTAPLTKDDRVEIVRRARADGWSLLDIQDRAGITKPERYLGLAQQEAS
ncbi:hypothetical protein [Nocardioides sp. 503]|uniref:hypothetical protein n=1 Tax=Nocardioides sp. 503 TaxID=2508326 RepID=UPI00106FB190|nr:hypothetical protein [Nocardioides sp. 503]